MLLELLDGLLTDALGIQDLVVHVHFLLGFHELVVFCLGLLLKHHLSLILVFPDELALARLLLVKAVLQALSFVLRFL